MLVHLFGATSSRNCAAFSLRQTAYDHGEKFGSSIANIVLHNFYINDCLRFVSSITEGIKVAKQLPALLRKREFRTTKWLITVTISSVARGGGGGPEPPHWLVKYAKSHLFSGFEADFL